MIRAWTIARRGALVVAFAIALFALSGCGLLGGSIDDFLENPGPAREPSGSGVSSIDGAQLYKRAAPSVVTVIVDYDGDGSAEGLGSGFAVAPHTIVTNVHVIGDLWSHREADDVFIQTRDGNRYPAAIVGTDSHADIAVLSVDYSEPDVASEANDALYQPPESDEEKSMAALDPDPGIDTPRLRPLKFGDSEALAVGDPVAAIGAPLGLADSLATGLVTGIDRTIPGLAGFQIVGAIQTDAAITLGNSGGPLLNADGEVVGVNDQIATVGGGGEGLAFAIPSSVVERSVREIERDGKVEYAYLGARTRPVPATLRDALGLPDKPGVLVFSVREDSPAARAGLRGSKERVNLAGSEWPEDGDYISAINGRPLRQNEKLTTALARFEPGDRVRLEVDRCCFDSDQGYRPLAVNVTLGERPLLWDE